jgi:hypothetical protein
MGILMFLASLKSYATVSLKIAAVYLESEVQMAFLMSLSSLKSYDTVSLKIPAVLTGV